MEDVTVRLTDEHREAVRQDSAALAVTETDVINRAIGVHHFVLEEVLAGSEVVFVRPDNTTWIWKKDQILGLGQ